MESEGESEEIPFSFAKRFSLHSNFALGRPNGRSAEDGKIAKDANCCDAQPRGNHWIPAVFGFWYQRSLPTKASGNTGCPPTKNSAL